MPIELNSCKRCSIGMNKRIEINKEQIQEMYSKGFANNKWLIDHYRELIRTYNNQFVAVMDGKVIDSDVDPEVLLNRLKKKGVDVSAVAIDFITDNPVLYLL